MHSYFLISLVAARNFKVNPALNDKGEIKAVFRTKLTNSVTSTGALNANQVAYTLTGNVGIGTPPQFMSVLFDSGSDLFWIRNNNCKAQECVGKNQFNSAASSTFVAGTKTTGITYGDGTQVQCTLASDSIQIGGHNFKNISICLANFIQTTTGSTDGIIGLAVPGDSPSGADLFASMTQQATTGQAIAGFWYDRSETINFSDPSVKAGEITFGGVDTSRFTPPFQYIPVDSTQQNWFTNLDSIAVNNQVLATSVSILLDTGTTNCIIPSKVYSQLNQIMNVDKNGNMPCSVVKSLPTMTFTWGSTVINLTWQQQVVIDLNSNTCSTIFQPGGPTDVMILGAQFLRNFYTVFDYGNNTGNARIGLAQPSDSVTITVPGSAAAYSLAVFYAVLVSTMIL
ncbi:hypothetical protein HDV04_001945 [Boothiomyces sp. JEL0838]|nr:hypothetical protein HDV04_001945 [Boothiomyces sp. JEL0838]